jgi:hypothetical protein
MCPLSTGQGALISVNIIEVGIKVAATFSAARTKEETIMISFSNYF